MSLKAKFTCTIVGVVFAISMMIIGVLSVSQVNLGIGGNVSFTAKGVRCQISEGTLKSTSSTGVETAVAKDEGSMQGFEYSTEYAVDPEAEKVFKESWSMLDLVLNENGDDLSINFTIKNTAPVESNEYIKVTIDPNSNFGTLDNMEQIEIDCPEYIAPQATESYKLVFKVKDKTLNASINGFNIGFYMSNEEPPAGINSVSVNNSNLGEISVSSVGENLSIVATPKEGSKFVGIKDKNNDLVYVASSSTADTVSVPYAEGDTYTVLFNSQETEVTQEGLTYSVFEDANFAVVKGESSTSVGVKTIQKTPGLQNSLNIESGLSINDSVIPVAGILATFNPNNAVVSIPDSIKCISPNAFANTDLVALKASETVINKINAPFKTTLDFNFNLTHVKYNCVWDEWISFDFKIKLTNSTNNVALNINYAHNETSSVGNLEDTQYTISNVKYVLVGKDSTKAYTLQIINNVTPDGVRVSGGGLVGISETALIKVGTENLYNTTNSTSVQQNFDKSFTNKVVNGQPILINYNRTYTTTSYACFVEGSLITLADGSAKKVEDITYDDLLLVWDFNRGEASASYPMWITRKLTTRQYHEITFDDGSKFYNVVAHRLYSTDEDYFVRCVDGDDYSQIGHNFFGIKTDANGNALRDENGNFIFVTKKIVSIELKTENKNYYNVMTGYSINAFVNSILSSSSMSNLYGKTPNMRFNSALMNERKNNPDLQYTKEELGLPDYFFYGLRLGEQKGAYDITSIIKYVKNDLSLQREIETQNGQRKWIVSTSENNQFTQGFTKQKVTEGAKYTLEAPKNVSNFAGWLCSSDGKIYQAGDEVTIYMGTHFIALYN